MSINYFRQLASIISGEPEKPVFEVREGLFYDRDHFWYSIEGDKVSCGFTPLFEYFYGEPNYIDLEFDDYAEQGNRLGIVETDEEDIDIVVPFRGEFDYIFDQDSMLYLPEGIDTDPYGVDSIIYRLDIIGQPEDHSLLTYESYIKLLSENNVQFKKYVP